MRLAHLCFFAPGGSDEEFCPAGTASPHNKKHKPFTGPPSVRYAGGHLRELVFGIQIHTSLNKILSEPNKTVNKPDFPKQKPVWETARKTSYM